MRMTSFSLKQKVSRPSFSWKMDSRGENTKSMASVLVYTKSPHGSQCSEMIYFLQIVVISLVINMWVINMCIHVYTCIIETAVWQTSLNG